MTESANVKVLFFDTFFALEFWCFSDGMRIVETLFFTRPVLISSSLSSSTSELWFDSIVWTVSALMNSLLLELSTEFLFCELLWL